MAENLLLQSFEKRISLLEDLLKTLHSQTFVIMNKMSDEKEEESLSESLKKRSMGVIPSPS